MAQAELWILGAPLNDALPFSLEWRERLSEYDLIVCESRRAAGRYLRNIPLKGTLLSLDPMRNDTLRELQSELEKVAKTGGRAALFSDSGMPLLFNPGREVLEWSRKLGLRVRCEPTATSWGTACAVSGWEPPFLLHGFLPQKVEERRKALQDLAKTRAHLVFLETPYRFTNLLEELEAVFGRGRTVFLAWQIAQSDEFYFWGTLPELGRIRREREMKKGEFVLIAKSQVGA